MSFASLRPVAALVASAVLGGVVAVGAVALLGGLDSGTTVVTETAAAPQPRARAGRRRRDERERDLRARRVGRRACHVDEQLDLPRAGSGSQSGSALGSGFVIDKTGHIVTNYHVVEGADEVTVSFSNRDTVKAEVVGTDPSTRPRGAARRHRGERAHAASARRLRRSRRSATRSSRSAIPFGLDRTVDRRAS